MGFGGSGLGRWERRMGHHRQHQQEGPGEPADPSFNLIPAGQLDGGHIVYALSPRAHKICSQITIAALLDLGTVEWKGRPPPMRSGFSRIQAKGKRSVKLVRGALPSSKLYM